MNFDTLLPTEPAGTAAALFAQTLQLSVMIPVYQEVRQELSLSDIANVRLLYRPTGVPEPATSGMLLLLMGMLTCAFRPSR